MLSDTAIRNAKPRKAPYKLSDSHGLHIEVRPTGAKLWRYRYRIAGKENLYALGVYATAPGRESPQQAEQRRAAGHFTLAEARIERDRCRALVKQGIHPAQQRKLEALERAYEGTNTFATIAREWVAQNRPHWTKRYIQQRERLLEREIFPHIGALPARKVKPAHVLAILKRLEKTTPSFAIMVRQIISAVFRLAISTLRADLDPTLPLRDAIKTPPTKHKTPLKSGEIRPFFQALEVDQGSFQTKAALRFMWLTLARTNEILGARWPEFDLDAGVWTIPAERMKKREKHVVPLPAQAVELLRDLQSLTGGGEFLFSLRPGAQKPMAESVLRAALVRMGYAGKFSPHAVRTTASTLLNEQGFSGDWIEMQLAHTERNKTRRAYNRTVYLEQRRGMMEQWADYIAGLCAGGNVTPIRRAAKPA